MEDSRFDQLTSDLANRLERRRVLLGAGLGALIAAGWSEPSEAGKKKKRRKRKRKKLKKKRCTSAYGAKLYCKPDQCCDPATSTIAACTELGFPTCCASSGKAHPLGTTCCSSYYHGTNGACSTDYPVCCSQDVGAGCCSASYPVCCDTNVVNGCCPNAYPVCCPNSCCPAGDSCTASGGCASLAGKSGASHEAPAPLQREQPARVAEGHAFLPPATERAG